MPEPFFRDGRKTEAEQREAVRQKFLDRCASLPPAALAIFDRQMKELQAAMAEGDKARTERRRRELLDREAACLQHMSPEVREHFEREIAPALRDGEWHAALNPDYPAKFGAGNVKAQKLKDARQKALQIYRIAMSRGDLTNANRAVQLLIRIQQVERASGNDMDEIEALAPPGASLPGGPGGRPRTKEEEKFQKELLEKTSSADRMAMAEAFEAAGNYVKLGGNLADLVKECFQPGGGDGH